MNYLLGRLVASFAQIAAASLLTFAVFSFTPGDYFTSEQLTPQRQAASLDRMRRDSGLAEPWMNRYGSWLKSTLHGDFGVSLAYGLPVRHLITPRLGATLSVALPALLLTWLIAATTAFIIPTRLLHLLEASSSAAALIPEVIAASFFLWACVHLGLPLSGPGLPILILTVCLLPVVFLHWSGSLSSARQLLFVRLAAQRGVSGISFWLLWVLPAAANPLLSLLGLSLSSTLGTCLLVEVLTGWPGLGPLFLEAVHNRDYPIVQSILLLLAATLSLANLTVDLLLYRLDPRIRTAS